MAPPFLTRESESDFLKTFFFKTFIIFNVHRLAGIAFDPNRSEAGEVTADASAL